MWPHVEAQITRVFADLIGGFDSPAIASQVSMAIISQQLRIKVMQTLLENGRQNRNKSQKYDHILEEFGKANALRNSYIHGLWTTHQSGRTFLESVSADGFGWCRARRVTAKELDNYIARLMKLHELILNRNV